MNKVETHRVGIAGDEPLLSMDIAMKVYDNFRINFAYEPTQLRVSPEAFNDLRAMAERTTMITQDNFMCMEIKVDYDLKDREWIVCKEETKVFAQ